MDKNDFDIQLVSWRFLSGRLQDQNIIDWAVELKPEQKAERQTLRDLFNNEKDQLVKLYKTAWEWIFYSWDNKPVNNRLGFTQISRDIRGDNIPARFSQEIMLAVRPTLTIDQDMYYVIRKLSKRRQPTTPKLLSDILEIDFKCDFATNISNLDLPQCTDTSFLEMLTDSLDAELSASLHLAHLAKKTGLTQLKISMRVRRVYHAETNLDNDPDEHSHGFAPCVKLLYESTARLQKLDQRKAQRRINIWKEKEWDLYKRLWAAATRNNDLTRPEEVSDFLLECTDKEFWEYDFYPEHTELRATYWNRLPVDARKLLEDRIRRGLPLSYWPRWRNITRETKLKFSVIELQRIIAGRGILSSKTQAWLDKTIRDLPDTPVVDMITHGFVSNYTVVAEDTTDREPFKNISSEHLLDRLEERLTHKKWDYSASEFVTEHIERILDLLEQEINTAIVRPIIYAAICMNILPDRPQGTADKLDTKTKFILLRVLKLLGSATNESTQSIASSASIGTWLYYWSAVLTGNNEFTEVWEKYWPYAVSETNENNEKRDEDDIAYGSVNSEVGYFTEAFLRQCPPDLNKTPSPFDDPVLERMRNIHLEASGLAQSYSLFILLKSINWFYKADKEWTETHLFRVLIEAKDNDPRIWSALTQKSLSGEVFELLSDSMIQVISDASMDENPLSMLARRIIWDTINTRYNNNKFRVNLNKLQNMLRGSTDDIRSNAIWAMVEYLEEGDEQQAAFDFRNIIKPLFKAIWPKDKSVRSRIESYRMAKLPFASKSAFSEAVATIKQYLVPFDCYGLNAYGFGSDSLINSDGEAEVDNNLSRIIATEENADALLTLLDKTIGEKENATRPSDLSRALAQVEIIAPDLTRDSRYKRLLSLARS